MCLFTNAIQVRKWELLLWLHTLSPPSVSRWRQSTWTTSPAYSRPPPPPLALPPYSSSSCPSHSYRHQAVKEWNKPILQKFFTLRKTMFSSVIFFFSDSLVYQQNFPKYQMQLKNIINNRMLWSYHINLDNCVRALKKEDKKNEMQMV